MVDQDQAAGLDALGRGRGPQVIEQDLDQARLTGRQGAEHRGTVQPERPQFTTQVVGDPWYDVGQGAAGPEPERDQPELPPARADGAAQPGIEGVGGSSAQGVGRHLVRVLERDRVYRPAAELPQRPGQTAQREGGLRARGAVVDQQRLNRRSPG